MLRDGFDVHHLDGDHSNDDPANLALIEHTDHMRLHGMGVTLGRLKPRSPSKGKPRTRVTRKMAARAIDAYEATKASVAAMHSPCRTLPQELLDRGISFPTAEQWDRLARHYKPRD